MFKLIIEHFLNSRSELSIIRLVLISFLASIFNYLSLYLILPFYDIITEGNSKNYEIVHSWNAFYAHHAQIDERLAIFLFLMFIIILNIVTSVYRGYYIAFKTNLVQGIVSKSLFNNFLIAGVSDKEPGEYVNYIINESQQFVNIFFRPVCNITTSLITVALVILLLLNTSFLPTLAIGFIFLLTYGSIILITSSKLKTLGNERLEFAKRRTEISIEAINAADEIYFFGLRSRYKKIFSDATDKQINIQVFLNVLGEIPQYFIQFFVMSISLSTVFIFSIREMKNESFDGLLPIFLVFIFAALRILPECQKIYNALSLLKFSEGIADRILAQMYTKKLDVTEISIVHSDDDNLVNEECLIVKNLTVRSDIGKYECSEFIAKSGELILINGKSGSGKTTILKAILGIIPSTSSRHTIYLDKALDVCDPHEKLVSYIPQEPFIWDDSLTENIVLNSELCRERLVDVIKICKLETLMNQRGDSKLGVQGSNISGGEKKRIALARACYHGAKVIILDEITAGLDSKTETELLNNLSDIAKDKIFIMVSHSLGIIQFADRVYKMQDGRLVSKQ
jgi:ABC-type bacteriocin/lantibiotic exporter with double-glycine peptidase domain